MPKLLKILADKCAGCMTCEMVCSATHEGTINPFQSRIKIIKWDLEGEGVPTVCAQCEEAPCERICPVRAISRNDGLGSMMVDYDPCIGCRMCVAACPFGVIHFDSINSRVIKCDLCDGTPMCVKFCPYDALDYVDASELTTDRRRAQAGKLLEFINTGQTP
jgi:Fe-S-cluster-containing hydrogenase component 2